MREKVYSTNLGDVHYWVSDQIDAGRDTLVFLPGLTADHRLFEKQVEFFEPNYNIFVWDAPGHAASYPFKLEFSLADKARWLHEILALEGIKTPVLVGQSMGGYVGQAYEELYPGELRGFVSIDSAPLRKHYMTGIEIWLLKHTEGMYRAYPWAMLVRDGARGCAETDYGRKLMTDIIMNYDDDHGRYITLVSHGYRILAEAVEADLPYRITCPAVLICGEKDKAGFTRRYNKKWTKETGIPIRWIPMAGHNSNTDAHDEINSIIEEFIKGTPGTSDRDVVCADKHRPSQAKNT